MRGSEYKILLNATYIGGDSCYHSVLFVAKSIKYNFLDFLFKGFEKYFKGESIEKK